MLALPSAGHFPFRISALAPAIIWLALQDYTRAIGTAVGVVEITGFRICADVVLLVEVDG